MDAVLNDRFESSVKLIVVLGLQELDLEATRSRSFLDVLLLGGGSRAVRVQKCTDTGYSRLHVAQTSKAFGLNHRIQMAGPSGIATGMTQARDIPARQGLAVD